VNHLENVTDLERKLEISEIKFQILAQTASDAILIIDENSNIVFANLKVEEVFGYT
jgi:PAS domain S-box-containing protein